MAQEYRHQGWTVETESERSARHQREQAVALRLREEILLDEHPGERLIRVMLAFNQASEYRSHTLLRAEIQSVASVEPNGSTIVLRSGGEIPVALPYRELEQKIYRPDFPKDDLVLDLRSVTGEGAKPKPSLRIPGNRT